MPYDYIIVGAGSAGATLAARLSEDPKTAVLLLEAGPDYRTADTPRELRIPNAWVAQDPERFPAYFYPGLHARCTTVQRPQPYLRGRGMGGSSAINSQVAIRGLPDDFDRWAEDGCTGWASDDVLPAFCRLEDDRDYGDAPYHGRGGPIPIWRTPRDRWGAVDRAVCTAALDLGYGWAEDHNAPGTTGVSPYATTSRDGVRVSANDAYLEPARGRDNLAIVGDALVDRVLFDGGRATGVRVRIAGEWQEVTGGETVLCAGAIHSPAILMRSGIGPAAHLRALGIAVLRDLPAVGQHLAEHPFVSLRLRLQPEARARSIEERMINCCVRYRSGLAGAGSNDMILLAANVGGGREADLAEGALVVAAFQVFSHGWVRLRATHPEADPEVELQMLSDTRDVERLRDGVRRAIDIVKHPAVAAITEHVHLAGSTGIIDDRAADEEVDAWMLATCGPVAHPAGTCRMGRADDPRTVVDPDCRVIGVDGLRVADASIMPEVPRANIHLACVMIGEHVAGRLRQVRH